MKLWAGHDFGAHKQVNKLTLDRMDTLNFLCPSSISSSSSSSITSASQGTPLRRVVVAVALLFYVHGKHLRSCRDGQLT